MSSTAAPQQCSTNAESVKMILEFAEREIEGQGHSVEHFDRKTGLILGFALISVAQIVAVLFRLSSEELLVKAAHPNVVVGLVVCGLLSVVAAITCGIAGLVPRTFEEFSVLDEIHKLNAAPEEIRLSMLKGLDASITANDDVLRKKSRLSKGVFILVSIALCLYLIAGTLIFVPLLKTKAGPPQQATQQASR